MSYSGKKSKIAIKRKILILFRIKRYRITIIILFLGSDVKKVKINWNDHLMVGLQFVESKDADNVNRIRLKVHSRKFNWKTGELHRPYRSNTDEYPTTEELYVFS